MGDRWHYSRGGMQYGPISEADLKRIAAGGDLSPTDMVWQEGMPNWVRAESIKGLFSPQAASASTPVSASPPPLPQHPSSQSIDPVLLSIGGFCLLLGFVMLVMAAKADDKEGLTAFVVGTAFFGGLGLVVIGQAFRRKKQG
jgi:GYF domain 2